MSNLNNPIRGLNKTSNLNPPPMSGFDIEAWLQSIKYTQEDLVKLPWGQLRVIAKANGINPLPLNTEQVISKLLECKAAY